MGSLLFVRMPRRAAILWQEESLDKETGAPRSRGEKTSEPVEEQRHPVILFAVSASSASLRCNLLLLLPVRGTARRARLRRIVASLPYSYA